MTIAVFGATGQLGALVLETLLSRGIPADQVVALGRNRAKLDALDARGFRTAAVDLAEPAGLTSALEGVETALLISGNEVGRRVQQHANAVDAAKSAGVARIVYTSAPRATTSALVLAPEHKATEEVLAASGLVTTVLRNNWYTENHRTDFDRAQQSGAITNSVGSGRTASAPRSDYAEAAAVVLTTDGHDGRVYELSGDTAWTFAEFAAAAAEVLDRPVEYVALSAEDEAAALRGAGLAADTIGFVVALHRNVADGLLAETTGELAQLLGRPTIPLAATLRTWAA